MRVCVCVYVCSLVIFLLSLSLSLCEAKEIYKEKREGDKRMKEGCEGNVGGMSEEGAAKRKEGRKRDVEYRERGSKKKGKR